MAQPNTLTAGKSFLERVLAKVDPTRKDAVTALLEDEAALTEIGAGVLRQEDYSRNIQRVKATADQQQEWWTTHKTALEEYEQMRQGDRRTTTETPHSTDIDARIEAMEKQTREQFAQLEANGVGLAAMLSGIGIQHFAEFGEVLNTEKLVREAIEAKQPLGEFYNGTVADRRKAKVDADLAKQIADAEARGREAGRMEALNRAAQPYPVGHDGQPSTLAGITLPGKETTADDYSLDAALRTLREETAKTR
jgi:hypothetical protein